MRTPWQVWLAFIVCLAMIVAAVGWLSFRALESERAETLARQQAQWEENARLALWRIDSKLAPLVTQESARPYFSYSTFFPVERSRPTKGVTKSTAPEPIPSPLVAQLPPLVLLHFQIDAAGHFSSPRVPPQDLRPRVVPKVLSAEDLGESKRLLDHAKTFLDRDKLLAILPPPELAAPTQIAANNFNGGQAYLSNSSNLRNNPGQNPENNGNYVNNTLNTANGPYQQAVAQQPAGQQVAALQQPNAPPVQANANPDFPNQGDLQQEQQSKQRGANDYQVRSQYLAAQNRANSSPQNDILNFVDSAGEERTAMMTPLWIGDQLVLARRVEVGSKELIQGCLLDWPAIDQQLRAAVADLLPEAKLMPVTATDEDISRRSAVLPVRLEVGTIADMLAPALSPVKMSLVVAWSSLLFGAVAVALLLKGVITLSERRASFVSAVTHELRTPLTTFRMYAEMLSEGMVPDEVSRHRYLDTLRIEADRLTHLVENVLAYSRLERTKPSKRVGPVVVEELLVTAASRLADRASQAGFELNVEAGDGVRQSQVLADPSAVEQILFNLVDNACKYAAMATNRVLTIKAEPRGGWLYLRVCDHGPGVDPARRRALFQAFRKSAEDAAVSAPGVGLGLALCRRLARDMGGDLRFEPQTDGACFALALKAIRAS